MSEETKNMILPKLRFPEFKDEGDWKEKRFDDIAEFLKGKGISKSDISAKGNLECIRYGELYTQYHEVIDIVTSRTNISPDELVLSEENDVIIPSSGETKEDIATASCVLRKGLAVGGDLNIIRSKMNGVFLSYYLNNVKKYEIAQVAQGYSVVHLYPDQLKKLIINIPEITEQQKIADCLFSLDVLITSQTQKLEALKTHKKGLMQELFPAEGETVPKRRFKEFEGSGEWEEKEIGKIAKVTTGGKDTQNKIDGGLYPFFVRSQTVERINSYSYDGEAILTSGDGVGVGKNFHYIKGKFDFHQRVYCINDFSKNISGQFVYLYFSEYFHSRVTRMSAKNSVDSVRMGMITEMPILLPSFKEQKKIADCLSSLDELIMAQTEKIVELKRHKKGLMQGLFPIIN